MVGEKRLVGLLLVLTGCGGNGASGDTPTPEQRSAQELRQAALDNIAQNVIVSQYEDFAVKAQALEDATQAWDREGTGEARLAAQAAWGDAMRSWQRAEVYQFGPAGAMGVVLGGEDIRDFVYSWPLTSPCRVDQEVVSQDYTDAATFFAEERVNVRGLDAMEYLLFRVGTENDCSVASGINSSGDWAALSEDDLNARRAAYSLALAQDVNARAQALLTHWSPDGEDFIAQVTGANSGSETYSSTQEALNALSDAMFYIEKETKDMKLAIPVGISGCDEDLCLEARESRWAGFSKEKMIANLEGFRAAFTGGEGEGFDDILVALGAQELSDDMLTATDEAIAALESWPGTFEEQLESDPDSVVEAYGKAKALGDLLKTQFIGTLDLELPQRAEGDND
jgi:predicted lipoprotein